MAKKTRSAKESPGISWLPDVEKHDYGAAESYLCLLFPDAKASGFVAKLRLAKVGDRVEAGAPLYRIHASSERALGEATELMRKAIAIGEPRRAPGPLVDAIIG